MELSLRHDDLASTVSSVLQYKLLLVFATVATALTLVLHLYLDYLAFVALGPGGTPCTPTGFLKIKLLSLIAVSNPYQAHARPSETCPAHSGYLVNLPYRNGDRPVTRGTAPHRQVTQKANQDMLDKLSNAIEAMGSTHGPEISGTSCIEKHGLALFNRTLTRGDEICHLHSSDGSMHMVLGNPDAKVVIEKGWAERHPLSHGGWFERFVPADFLMVYAPRDEAELEIVLRVIRAAA